jgi:hypothetical protein
MWREVLELARRLPTRIVVGDGQDLVVMPFLVGHVEHAHRAGANDAAREGRLRNQDEDVERVAVLRQRAIDEAVVGRVMHARVEDPVEHESMTGVVELVLVAAAERDLDRHLDPILRVPGA